MTPFVNIDGPGFTIALLAIIAGLRLATFVVERLSQRLPAVAPHPVLVPDEAMEPETSVITPNSETPQVIATPETAQPVHRFSLWNELLNSAFIAVLVVFVIIRPFVLEAFFIPSGSMIPTLEVNDRLLVTKYNYDFHRLPRHGDIVVFHAPSIALETAFPQQNSTPQQPMDYVKRVIGLPGDHLRVVAGMGVLVNGNLVKEPYVRYKPDYNFPVTPQGDLTAFADDRVRAEISRHVEGRDLVVPPGHLFVLGDNRSNSHDGHQWGFLPQSALVGKADFIFWPPNRIRMLH